MYFLKTKEILVYLLLNRKDTKDGSDSDLQAGLLKLICVWADHAEKSHSKTPTIEFCSLWDVSPYHPALGYPQRSGCLNQKQHAACWRGRRQSHE